MVCRTAMSEQFGCSEAREKADNKRMYLDFECIASFINNDVGCIISKKIQAQVIKYLFQFLDI